MKNFSKITSKFNMEFRSLSGIVRQLKNNDKLTEIFKTVMADNKIAVNLVTAKNLSYFISIENKEQILFNIEDIESLLTGLSKFIDTNAKLCEKNCKVFQLLADKKRINTILNNSLKKSEKLQNDLVIYNKIANKTNEEIVEKYLLVKSMEQLETKIFKYESFSNDIEHNLSILLPVSGE